MISSIRLHATVLAFATTLMVSQALAASKDYAFQLVETEIKQGDAIVAVKLTDLRSGKPVPDAIVFATRMDMAPDNMETMTTPVEATTSEQPGIYKFKTNLVMAGGWRFSIAAKIQGEPETVESKLVLKAVK